MLFWASWCLPCQAEIAQLDMLSVAARPLAVVIVPIEARSEWQGRLSAIPPTQIWQPPGGAVNLMLRLGGGASLPFSAASNANGQLCASANRSVSVTQLRQWARLCATRLNPPPNPAADSPER